MRLLTVVTQYNTCLQWSTVLLVLKSQYKMHEGDMFELRVELPFIDYLITSIKCQKWQEPNNMNHSKLQVVLSPINEFHNRTHL